MKRRQIIRQVLIGIGVCLCFWLSTLQVHAADQLVYIGTGGSWAYGAPPPAKRVELDMSKVPPQGIYAARFDTETGHLTSLGIQAVLETTSWLVTHPSLPVVYTTASAYGGKPAQSDIFSFTIERPNGKLWMLNKVKSGGCDATHLYIDAASNTMIVANHENSVVTALPIEPDGSLGQVASTMEDFGHGPNPRQSRPEPHGVVVDPTHRYALCADFGADRIFVYNLDGATRALTPANPPFMATPPGSAPRHLVFSPNGRFLYLNTELNAGLYTFGFDPKNGNLNLIQELSTYPTGWKEKKSGSEIGTSRDGRFVYVSLRDGQNCIVVYAVNGQDGTLTEIQRIPSQGETPSSFGIDPTGHWMLVANTKSNAVAVFSIDPATGKLTATNEAMQVTKPAVFAFYAN